jgi:MoxR-like ATPase
LQAKENLESVHLDADNENYIVELIQSTRRHRKIAVGASPRGSLALLKLARAWAAMHERAYVLPVDARRFVRPVLGHRIILDPDLWAMPNAAENVIDEIIHSIPVPVLEI